MTMNKQKIVMVKCPTCKKEVTYSLDNPYRPFCSERCKLIDLGMWASEEFRIPLNSSPQEEGYFDDDTSKTSLNDDESI